jgi:hypothetical protein
MTKEIYYGTIAWDGYDEYTEGEYTIHRYSLNDLLDDLLYYMDKFKNRSPYIESASKDVDNIEVDITAIAQEFIKQTTEEINGK